MNAELVELTEAEFASRLTERFGTINICGLEYDSGTALQELDPTAFDVAHADEPEEWKCCECDEAYDNENEAEDCCQEEYKL